MRLVGTWSLQAGWSHTVADVDADGCDDLVLGETRNFNDRQYSELPLERVVLIDQAPLGSSTVLAAGRVVLESDTSGDYETSILPWGTLGYRTRWDPTEQLLLVNAPVLGDLFDLAAFEVRKKRVAKPQEAVGWVRAGNGDWSLSLEMGVLQFGSAGYLWTGTYETVGERGFAGDIYLFEMPLAAWQDEGDAVASIRADPGDFASTYWDGSDLDDDGSPDLVVGTSYRGIGGAVAVLAPPPTTGDHPLWDVAFAAVDGTEPDAVFGDHVSGGDLDGDHQHELVIGAPTLTGTGALHVFRGPIGPGNHTADDSDWTFRGENTFDRLGVSAAVGDFDGDGVPDLAIGRPANPARSDLPGSVVVFRGPVAPGEYLGSDADLVLTNALPAPGDFFGAYLDVGDLNGDGADELVVSAPNDPEGGKPVGSVQIVYGRSDLFPSG